MYSWYLISIVTLLLPPVFDPHPLGDSQLARLETADDGSATVDEAAFYALLENAADWSDKEGGALVPDFDAIRRSPEDWRGVRCLIEGTLYRVLKPTLGRKGWERVHGVVIRVDDTRETPIAQDFVIVYLTDPPEWKWNTPKLESEGVPSRHGSRVRLVGRFFKMSSFTTQGSRDAPPAEREYLAFVGRELRFVSGPKPTGDTPSVRVPIMLGAILLGLAFLVWRLRAMATRRDRAGLREYLERRHAERAIRGEAEDEADEGDMDLPDNAADALDTLSHRRREEEVE